MDLAYGTYVGASLSASGLRYTLRSKWIQSMRLVLTAMTLSILSILAFKYADHSIGYDIFMDDAHRAAVEARLIETQTASDD